MRELSFLTALVLLVPSGCQRSPVQFREVKRIHEKVTEAEMQQFLRIVDSLPGKELPELPPVYRPLPNWRSERTLPVNELVNEEKKLLDEAWDVETLTRKLKRNRPLRRVLRREQLTLKQFAGLFLTIAAARSRSQLRDDQDLDQILSRGRSEIAELQKDDRPFSQLSREARFAVLRRAGWLTRVDRANRLKDVPPENVALVKKHAEQLDEILPAQFLENPLDSIADLLEERGMPFEELESSGRDDRITWGPEDDPLIGNDPPDAPAEDVSGTVRPAEKPLPPVNP